MIEVFTINNYKIILNKIKGSKLTRVEALINNGFLNEDMDNLGISHLLEHIITDSLKKCKNNCSNYWKKRGVITNAMTTETNVRYYITGLEKFSNDMIEYIITICSTPTINKIILEKEKKAVINELLIHDSHPQIDLMNKMNEIFYRIDGLKYQDDNKLQIKNLKNITVDKIKKWFNRYYGPSNMVFLIMGNFNKAKTLRFLNKKLNKITNNVVIPKYVEIFNQGIEIEYVKNTTMDNTCIEIAFSSSVYQRDKESKLIDLFLNFINSNVTSILMDVLREKKKLIYSISVDTNTNPYGSYLMIEVFTKNNNIKEVVLTTIKILKGLLSGNFTKEYLEHVKTAYTTIHYLTCEDISFLTTFYGEQYINQIMNVSDNPKIINYKDILKLIKNINKSNFILFLKKYIIFQNMKIVYQGKKYLPNLKQSILNKIK